jgi:hypothetical protein
VRGARLIGYLEGKVKAPSETLQVEEEGADGKKTIVEVKNPAYVAWIEKDQVLMSYLVKSLSFEVLVQVTECQTSCELWTAIQTMYASQSRARS